MRTTDMELQELVDHQVKAHLSDDGVICCIHEVMSGTAQTRLEYCRTQVSSGQIHTSCIQSADRVN